MESLSRESKALYDLLMLDTKEEYEKRFLDYKKEVLDAMQPFVADTRNQFKEVRATVESVKSSVSSDLEATRAQLGGELVAVRTSLSSEISQLATAIGRILRPDPGAVTAASPASPPLAMGATTIGPDGYCCEHQTWGKACVDSMSPPGGAPTRSCGSKEARIFFSVGRHRQSIGHHTHLTNLWGLQRHGWNLMCNNTLDLPGLNLWLLFWLIFAAINSRSWCAA